MMNYLIYINLIYHAFIFYLFISLTFTTCNVTREGVKKCHDIK